MRAVAIITVLVTLPKSDRRSSMVFIEICHPEAGKTLSQH